MLSKEELFAYTIEEPDATVCADVKKRWDALSKPIDGLGDLETLVCRIAAMQGTKEPHANKRAAVIFCADNGIVEEGVSQCGSEVTYAVASAIGKGISSACTIAKSVRADVCGIDIGIDAADTPANIINARVRRGTRDFLKEPAMHEDETLQAIETGMRVAQKTVRDGYDILVTGEMGIGNTTTSSAMLLALLCKSTEAGTWGDENGAAKGEGNEHSETTYSEMIGRGAGLDEEGFARKKAVIREALSKYEFPCSLRGLNMTDDSCLTGDQPEKVRTFSILQTLGGLDIAGLTGFYIGAAKCRVPVVIDGLISATAALSAQTLVPGTKAYMIASHRGREKGTQAALDALGLEPLLLGNMALGEGTGALMILPLLDTALAYYRQGAGFDAIHVDAYTRF